MYESQLSHTITVAAGPISWRGEYVAWGDRGWDSVSWYWNDKPKTLRVPHVTVVRRGRTFEVAESGEWVGFHVSYPTSAYRVNMHAQVAINNGTTLVTGISFKNIEAELESDVRGELRRLHGARNIQQMKDLFAPFAQAFYDAQVALQGSRAMRFEPAPRKGSTWRR